MEFKKLMNFIEANKEEHFYEIIKKNENVISKIDMKTEEEK